jgi:hypothetical protein
VIEGDTKITQVNNFIHIFGLAGKPGESIHDGPSTDAVLTTAVRLHTIPAVSENAKLFFP